MKESPLPQFWEWSTSSFSLTRRNSTLQGASLSFLSCTRTRPLCRGGISPVRPNWSQHYRKWGCRYGLEAMGEGKRLKTSTAISTQATDLRIRRQHSSDSVSSINSATSHSSVGSNIETDSKKKKRKNWVSVPPKTLVPTNRVGLGNSVPRI